MLHNKLPQNSMALNNEDLFSSYVCGLEVGRDQLLDKSSDFLV